MVFADVARSTEGLGDAFREMDLATIGVAGGLGAVAFSLVITTGSMLGGTVGSLLGVSSESGSRVLSVLIALGSLVVGYLGATTLGAAGNVIALGAVLAVGSAIVTAIIGPSVPNGGADAQGVMEAARMDSLADTAMPTTSAAPAPAVESPTPETTEPQPPQAATPSYR